MSAFHKSGKRNKPDTSQEPVQQKTGATPAEAKQAVPPASGINFTVQRQENKTGMPDNLKSGLENMSGHDLSDVRVHYNSSKPAQLQAHAYAQGNQIHLGPGQEKHLPHEGWHVVQQKQGRVQATTQLKQADAAEYITANKLGIEATKEAVKQYIDDSSNPEASRMGLLLAWNKDYISRGWIIPSPPDLGGGKPKRDLSPSPKREEEDQAEKPSKKPKTKKKQELKEEVPDEKKEAVANAPVRDSFKNVIAEFKFSSDLAKEIAVDWVLDKKISLVEFAMYDIGQVASCFRTAEGLFALLGNTGVAATQQKGKMKVTLPLLMDSIRAEGLPRVYWCGVNEVAHGFSIVVQGDSTELLQSFAGPSGETLLNNITDHKNLPRSKAELLKLLAEMAGDADKSFAAQNALFGGSIDIEKIPATDKTKLKLARKNPALRIAHKDEQTDRASVMFYRVLTEDIFHWKSRPLLSTGQIEAAIRQKIKSNLSKLPKK